MILEIGVERYRFTCANCGHIWITDYDVQYMQDYGGDVWAYYRLNGVPVLAPVADEILCPACWHGKVRVELVARRDVPVASLDRDEPRQRVTATPAQRRDSAPPLRAQE